MMKCERLETSELRRIGPTASFRHRKKGSFTGQMKRLTETVPHINVSVPDISFHLAPIEPTRFRNFSEGPKRFSRKNDGTQSSVESTFFTHRQGGSYCTLNRSALSSTRYPLPHIVSVLFHIRHKPSVECSSVSAARATSTSTYLQPQAPVLPGLHPTIPYPYPLSDC